FRQDVGARPQPDYVLGRKDTRKPFTPKNAGWQPKLGEWYGRKSHPITHAGKTLTLKEWSKRIGITYEGLRQRIAKCQRYGADISEALTTPAGQQMPCAKNRVGRPSS